VGYIRDSPTQSGRCGDVFGHVGHGAPGTRCPQILWEIFQRMAISLIVMPSLVGLWHIVSLSADLDLCELFCFGIILAPFSKSR
jgi:hypothetical protein